MSVDRFYGLSVDRCYGISVDRHFLRQALSICHQHLFKKQKVATTASRSVCELYLRGIVVEFDTREAVREYLRSITGLDDERYSERPTGTTNSCRNLVTGHAQGSKSCKERLFQDKRVVDMFRVSRPEVSRSVNKYKAHHKEFVRGVLHKNGEMKQSKKLLEDIAGIAGNCLTVCPSQEGKSRLHLWIRTCGLLDIWSHHKGILRRCPQESPLANGQILIYGQVLIRLLAGSMTNRCVQVVDGDAHVSIKISQAAREESQGVSWIRWYEAQFIQLVVGSKSVSGGSVIAKAYHGLDGCVESLSSSDDWMAGPVQSSSGCCTIFKEFDSRLSAHRWNRKAKEKINLQRDVQVSTQALEQVRDFDSKGLLLISSRGVTRYEIGNGIVTYLSSGVMSMFKEDHEGTSSLAQGGAERGEKKKEKIKRCRR
ncbi:hypothetical protein DY000_02042156 [Brassica cretica]|uniref:Uncharacterized protein n=1 Tax=Brassica cretica TaxID=69181 RepID=A0ABQ7B801_BRACR|nr:hypothetical protein DY000_02042156 [Brassica cretica]